MATNTNAPFGFRQYAGNGSAPTYEQVAAFITAGANAIYFGDPVTWQSDGSVARSASTGATPASLGIAGVFVGCKYLSAVQKRTVWSNYYPGGTDPQSGTIEAYVVNDPNAKFVVQSDATGIAAADINSTIGFLIGSGNTANGISGAYLSGIGPTTATLPFRIVGLVVDPPGAPGTASGAYNKVIVAFNNVTTKNQTGI